MKKKYYRYIYISMIAIILNVACEKSISNPMDNNNATNGIEGFENGILTDVEGNTYRTIQIGNQTWLGENWRCEHNTEGNNISGVFVYNNDNANINEHGRLYTWQAAINACPTGWRLPNQSDWNGLINSLGNDPVSKLLDGGTSGFDAQLSGRLGGGSYGYIDALSIYWSSTRSSNSDHAIQIMIIPGESQVIFDHSPTNGGNSVRYIKD